MKNCREKLETYCDELDFVFHDAVIAKKMSGKNKDEQIAFLKVTDRMDQTDLIVPCFLKGEEIKYSENIRISASPDNPEYIFDKTNSAMSSERKISGVPMKVDATFDFPNGDKLHIVQKKGNMRIYKMTESNQSLCTEVPSKTIDEIEKTEDVER